MMSAAAISKLTKSDKSSFILLMSRAFSRDPLFLHLFGDPQHDLQARIEMDYFLSFMFDKSFMLHEEVWGYYDKESLIGAYVVEKPHATKLQQARGAVELTWRLLGLFRKLSLRQMRLLNAYMRITRSSAPKWAHYYLIMIGVTPENQGQGVGKALMHHLMDRVHSDLTSQGVALDTENRDNVQLYRKLGFALDSDTKLNTMPVYCMSYRKHNLY